MYWCVEESRYISMWQCVYVSMWKNKMCCSVAVNNLMYQYVAVSLCIDVEVRRCVVVRQ